MNKFLKLILIMLLVTLPAFAETLEGGITFDWITKTQMQRDENISQIRSIIFQNLNFEKFSKKEFSEKYKANLKDKDFLINYERIGSGLTEDENNNYCAFFKDKLFIAYGIQNKDDLEHIYYYDVLGNLRWVEVYGGNYPNYPYWAYQYYRNGKFVAANYYLSSYDQYMFNADGEFIGRAYKENIYNRKAKVIMTRSNY